MFADCNETCACVHVGEPLFNAYSIAMLLRLSVSPRDRRESHQRWRRQPVINPSTICQREQQKAIYSSSFVVALTAPSAHYCPNIISCLTSCHWPSIHSADYLPPHIHPLILRIRGIVICARYALKCNSDFFKSARHQSVLVLLCSGGKSVFTDSTSWIFLDFSQC